jgi:lysine 2,3-aminomutase
MSEQALFSIPSKNACHPSIEKKEWRLLLSRSVTSADQLSDRFPIDEKLVARVIDRYPMRINPYFLSLIKAVDDPLGKQVLPDVKEIQDETGEADPLAEEAQSPVPNLIHRYPDRVVFKVSNQCAVYCRFCMRKRKVGRGANTGEHTITAGLQYIAGQKDVGEVILSGGDPLLLGTDVLERILVRLKRISHVQVIRIHSRMPSTLPQRITPNLVQMLKAFQPLYVNTHFNHPAEMTPEAALACNRLADAGIPLGGQTVLLKGVNDKPRIMQQLFQVLVNNRVKPYYLHQVDRVQGVKHFQASIATGLKIMSALRGHLSGICVPQYMLDIPGGGGKIPLLPEYIETRKDNGLVIKNFEGRHFPYPL